MSRLINSKSFKLFNKFFSTSNHSIVTQNLENIKYNYIYLSNITNKKISCEKNIEAMINDEDKEIDRLAKVAAEHALRN